jgi:type IV pilus assembly protein PilM
MLENFIGGNKNSFGLDIGYSSIKTVELKKNGKFFSLVGYNETAIPENSIKKNSITNKPEMIKAIRQAVSSTKPHKITLSSVCSAIPSSHVFTKILKLPQMKSEELDKAVYYEVADFFPIPVSEMNIDWHIMINSNSNKEIELLVIGTSKTLVNDYIEIFSKSGLSLTALETKPIANARAIFAEGKNEASVLVDIGSEATSISFLDNNTIVISTVVPVGSSALTRDLAKTMDVTIEKAENAKKTNKFEFGKEDLITKNLAPIIQEIKDSIRYFEVRIERNGKINNIFLCGGGSQLHHLDKYIEKELKIPTTVANPWERIRLRPSDASSPKDALKYTTAIGLAMREL